MASELEVAATLAGTIVTAGFTYWGTARASYRSKMKEKVWKTSLTRKQADYDAIIAHGSEFSLLLKYLERTYENSTIKDLRERGNWDSGMIDTLCPGPSEEEGPAQDGASDAPGSPFTAKRVCAVDADSSATGPEGPASRPAPSAAEAQRLTRRKQWLTWLPREESLEATPAETVIAGFQRVELGFRRDLINQLSAEYDQIVVQGRRAEAIAYEPDEVRLVLETAKRCFNVVAGSTLGDMGTIKNARLCWRKAFLRFLDWARYDLHESAQSFRKATRLVTDVTQAVQRTSREKPARQAAGHVAAMAEDVLP